MKIIERVRDFINNLDEKNFYKYLGISLGVVVMLCAFMIYRYYSNVDSLLLRINNINEQRERAQLILKQAQRVNKQRADVDAMIAKDEGFKIGGYFNEVLMKLRLTDKRVLEETAVIQHEGKYQESVLKAKLTDMNMKELCELLNELDQNKRIYTKELEIISVKKARPSLDINLTIAALEPKPATQG